MKSLVFLFIMITVMSCAQIRPQTTHTYLALGDSYTIGESLPESERYPMQLADRLNANGYNISKPKIIAKTGWTTDELMLAIEKENIKGQTFDMVSLLIGVNNQYRGRDPEVYRKEFIQLLDIAISFAGGDPKKVFIVSIPDWGVTPFGKKSTKSNISTNIDLFNAINKEETLRKNILYVDITPGSRNANNDLTLVANDGLHPSGKMYREWVDRIMEVVFGK